MKRNSKFKALAVLLAVATSMFTLVGCGADTTAETGEDKAVVGFVTGLSGLGDQAFNDGVHEGILKAQQEHDFELKVVESKEVADLANNLRALANEGSDVVIVPGGDFVDGLKEVSVEYPDVTFFGIDTPVDGIDNVVSVVSKEEEASFLAGAFAALTSETGKVGFVGATTSPVQARFENGFVAGALTAKPGTEVVVTYAGTYSDVGKGKEIAMTMYNQGVDLISPTAGAVNLGVFQAAVETGHKVLGAGTGQFNTAIDNIIASQVKSVDTIAYNLLKEYFAGDMQGGQRVYGLLEEGVNLLYSPNEALNSTISGEVLDQIEALRGQIIDGTIKVPTTTEELEAYKSAL